jgi:integrase
VARTINRLSARSVSTVKETGLHADGGGLYLRVDKTGAKRWAFLFRWRGKRTEMGLGSVLTVSLADARERAKEARQAILDGENPIEKRRREGTARGLPTFGAVADKLVEDLSPQCKNAVHRAQWKTTLEVDAAALRALSVASVTTEDVLGVLRPIWKTKPETASRVRGRIERVLDAAKAKGLRTGENPARWKGHLALLLPQRQKLTRGHHPAMPFDGIPDLIAKLRAVGGVAPRALEFTILTAARTGETIAAMPAEFDLEGAVWIVPAERMKSGRIHRVPLSNRALQIVRGLWPADDDPIFRSPIARRNSRPAPLSNMAMLGLLRDLGLKEITVHGFRSSFRDWAGEVTTYSREVAEAALGHVIGDKSEQAYRRGDALAKRRELMDAWTLHCQGSKNLALVA